MKEGCMPGVRVWYVDVFFTCACTRRDQMTSYESFTPGQLLSILSGRYGPKFIETGFNKEVPL